MYIYTPNLILPFTFLLFFLLHCTMTTHKKKASSSSFSRFPFFCCCFGFLNGKAPWYFPTHTSIVWHRFCHCTCCVHLLHFFFYRLMVLVFFFSIITWIWKVDARLWNIFFYLLKGNVSKTSNIIQTFLWVMGISFNQIS